MAKLAKRIPRLAKRIACAKALRAALPKRIAAAAKRIATLVKRISSVRKRIARLTVRIARPKKRIATVLKRIPARLQRITRPRKRITTPAKRITPRVKSIAVRRTGIGALAIPFPPTGTRSSRVAIRRGTRLLCAPSAAIRIAGAEASIPRLAIRFPPGYNVAVSYTMADLVEATGVTARTIRSYIAHGYIEPPKGHGLGAVYTERHYLKAIALVRMRAAGDAWQEIIDRLTAWSPQRLRAYVEKTAPAPAEPPRVEPAPAPLDGAPVPPALEGDSTHPRHQLPRAGSGPGGSDTIEAPPSGDEWLPQGPRWVPVPLLPGLALWVREDAAPIVRRAAADIVRRYGSS